MRVQYLLVILLIAMLGSANCLHKSLRASSPVSKRRLQSHLPAASGVEETVRQPKKKQTLATIQKQQKTPLRSTLIHQSATTTDSDSDEASSENLSRSEVIEKIYERILELQIQEGDRSDPSGQVGSFRATVGPYLIDEENSEKMYRLRQKVKIPDETAFNTGLVSIDLLEIQSLGLLSLDATSTTDIFQALLESRCENFPDHVPVFSFGPQEPSYSPLGKLLGYIQLSPGGDAVRGLWNAMTPEMKEVYYERTSTVISPRPRLPPDFDSTGVLLINMAYLSDQREKHEDLYAEVRDEIRHFKALANRVSLASYQPFINSGYDSNESKTGEDSSQDVNDPRMYLWFHDYLHQKKQQAEEDGETPDLRLITSWAINQQEIVQDIMELIMINSNDIDYIVQLSFIRGVITLVLRGDEFWDSDEDIDDFYDDNMQQCCLDSADLLLWMVKNDIIDQYRLIVSMYIESNHAFLHAGKMLQQLRKYTKEELPYDSLAQVRDIYEEIVTDYWTDEIIDSMVIDENAQEAYCDGYMGNYNGKTWQEDRLYCTSFRGQALLSFWTVLDDEDGLLWLEDTPTKVKEVVKYAGNYVERVVLDEDTSLEAIVYGLTEKSTETYAYRYPANISRYSNGTEVEPHDTDLTTVDLINLDYNIKGYVEDEEYQDMKEQLWFQKEVPTEYRDINQPEYANDTPVFGCHSMVLSQAALLLAELEVLEG